jgi:hypothetical protein
VQTLKDIVESFLLYAVCVDCDRMEGVPLEPLMAKLGPDTRVLAVRDRLRCRGCGQRTGDIRIVYVGSPDRRAFFNYRRGSRPEPDQSVSSSVDSSLSPKPSTPT